MSALHVIKRNSIVNWRAWRSSFFLRVLSPIMFLSAMGLGLGSLIEEERAFGGVDYLAFFATGMLAASCMQAGVFSATYPMMSKIIWQRNYEALLATPLTVRDIFLGELGWIGVVLAQLSIPFFAAMALFGVLEKWTAVLAIPVVVLLGMACASMTMVMTSKLQTDEAYTWVFRFVVTPLFLLSGTFFPISELPAWGRAVAELTPLYHGVELTRQLALYEVTPSAVWHLAYLVAMLAIGVAVGVRSLEKRLVQ
jgi:lipooligosaccharide transport system permease protein